MKKIAVILFVIMLSAMLFGKMPTIKKEGSLLLIKGDFEIDKNITRVLEREEFVQLKMENSATIGDYGEAELPAFSKLVSLPAVGNYVLSDFKYDFETVNLGQKIVPNGWEDKISPKNEFYARDKWFPEEVVIISKPNIMRGVRFSQITIAAVQYNPQQNKLRILKNIRAEFQIDENNRENPLIGERNICSKSFEDLAKKNIFGFQRERSSANGKYLFIIPNSNLIENNIEELARWKEKLGFATEIVRTSETGMSNSEIKNYIQNAYDTWEVPPEFVVLVGDQDGTYAIPTFFVDGYLTPTDVSDLPYSLLEGEDYFPDVMLGRLSYRTPFQLQTIISKIINYEKNPVGGNWMKKALMTCYFDYNFASPRETKVAIREKLLDFDFTVVDTFFSPYQSNSGQLMNMINQGYSFINYRGYGSYDYWVGGYGHLLDSYHVENLANGFMLPMVTGIVCGGGDYGATEAPSCFGETWLNAGNPSSPKGAIAFIGPSERDTKTQFNNANDIGIYQGITQENLFRCGEMLLRGKMEMYKDYPTCHNWGNSLNSDQFYFYVYNLLGDPGLSIWTDIPKNVSVFFNSPLNSSQNFVAVQIDAQENEKSGFIVAITNEDSLIAAGITNELGKTNIPVSLFPGEYEITVSKQGYIPQTEDLSVEESGALGLVSYIFNPSTVLGEDIDLQITIKNLGEVGASDINVSLTSEDGLTNILSDNLLLTSIPAAETETCQFTVNFVKLWDSSRIRELKLNIDSNYGEQEFLIPVEIQAPELTFTGLNVPDMENQLLQNSEAEVYVVLQNLGNIFSGNFTAELNSLNNNVEIISGTSSYENITAGSSGMCFQPFMINIGNVVSGELARFRLDVFSNGDLVQQIFFDYPIGIIDENAPTFCDYGYCAIESADNTSFAAPDYNWIELRPNSGGSGTSVSIDYSTSDGYLDIVDLPADFHFRYFGKTFDKITIASNGYVNLGESRVIFHRNRTIPSGVGPNNMIAPFWDDLSGGTVYYLYDAVNHYFVVEWYHTNNTNSPYYNNTFEVILYDSEYYPTANGDGKILFQYKEIHNIDQYDNYATVGIENETQDDGILITNSNIYTPTAHILQNYSAILFTVPQPLDSPFLSVSADEINVSLEEGKTKSEILFLANNGPENSLINFTVSVSESETKSKNNMTRPLNWLSLPVSESSIEGESSKEIPVIFSAENVNSGEYSATISISTDQNENFEIPVNLIVTPTFADDNEINDLFELGQNHPNPFANYTTISFLMDKKEEKAIIEIYNIKGQKVKKLVGNKLLKGWNSIVWDGKDKNGKFVNSGIYFYKLTVNGKTKAMKKCLLLK